MIFENRELYFALFFLGTFAVSFLVYRLVLWLSGKLNVYDFPNLSRKIHTRATPSLGGLAIFLTFLTGLVVLGVMGGTDEVSFYKITGIVIGGAILIIGGILDARYDLPPIKQIIFPVLAAATVVLFGSHISYITNPFGGAIILDQFKIGPLPVLGGLVVFAWIMGMTYTTKFLDGMDGLVTGIAGIAGIVIFGLSLAPDVNQTTTAFLALIFAASCFGFLRYNFHPAKMFLGEGGSTFAGFMIGVLAVISGAKIATALLVLGIPILDAAWVIFQRLWFRKSPFVGDNKHLHFRLFDLGLTQRQAVLFLYLLTAVFGGIAVFLQSLGKLVALGVLVVVMTGVIVAVAHAYKGRENTGAGN